MQHSESIANLSKALIAAQGKMDGVRKTSINPAFRSKYADLAAVVDAVVPELQAAGIAVVQGASSHHDEHGYCVTVETMFVHESGEWLKSELGLRPTKSDPQGAGSAITYGRRYLLLAMAGVAPEDDDGNAASGGSRSAQPPAQRPQVAPPAATAPGATGAKIDVAGRAKFNQFTSQLPPEEVAAIVRDVQKHYQHEETGNVADLYDGDEARDAFKFIQRAVKNLAGQTA